MNQIASLLPHDNVVANLDASSKKRVFEQVGILFENHQSVARSTVYDALFAREKLGSTGLGQGIAIPHGKSDCINKLVAAFGVSRSGVQFDSLDGEPAHLFFLLVAPEDAAGPHLKALARISRLLKDKHFRDSLQNAIDEKQLVKIMRDEDERRH